MENFEKIKIILASVCAWVGAVCGKAGVIVPLTAVLLVTNCLDWITGNAASIAEGGGVSSDRGRRGIAKKAGYWAEVGLGLMVDIVLIFVVPAMQIGGVAVAITTPIVGPTICLWLCLNEILSIIENLGRMGVPVPPWLSGIITVLKATTENGAEDMFSRIGQKKENGQNGT